jgi:hypothetical protein
VATIVRVLPVKPELRVSLSDEDRAEEVRLRMLVPLVASLQTSPARLAFELAKSLAAKLRVEESAPLESAHCVHVTPS